MKELCLELTSQFGIQGKQHSQWMKGAFMERCQNSLVWWFSTVKCLWMTLLYCYSLIHLLLLPIINNHLPSPNPQSRAIPPCNQAPLTYRQNHYCSHIQSYTYQVCLVCNLWHKTGDNGRILHEWVVENMEKIPK